MSNVNTAKDITLQRLRKLSNLLDNAIPIPGTNYRIGLDPLLGLLPGGGDTIGAFLSAYIVLEAANLGAPRETLVRMVSNIIFESILGTLPGVGDIFDAAWKANAKNLALLEAHLNSPLSSQKVNRWFVILLLAGLILFIIMTTTISVVIIRLIWSLVTGS